MAFPSTLTAFTDPNASDRLSSPSHSSIESAQNTGLEEVQAFIGTLSSTAGTLMYDVRAAASNGGGHVQTAAKGGTGQTVFTKGDLLVASGASVLSKLAVGSVPGAALIIDSGAATGMKWSTSPIPPMNIQSFVSAGTHTWVKPSISGTMAFVQVWGAGGSGGKGDGSGGAGGGGGGAYAERWITTSLLGATENVTVGTGGASIVAASTVGLAGGTTDFGASSILTAYGGAGGGRGLGGGSPAGGGGGGGGGIFGVGTVGVNASSGSAGAGGAGGAPNTLVVGGLGWGGLAGGSVVGANAFGGGGGGGGAVNAGGQVGGFSGFGGGGGGGGCIDSAGNGGSAVFGGGGGGGAGASASGNGGNSENGGSGSGGTISATASVGSAPGGGGGGTVTGTSGGGAPGRVIVTLI